jgi:hypothetical protein
LQNNNKLNELKKIFGSDIGQKLLDGVFNIKEINNIYDCIKKLDNKEEKNLFRGSKRSYRNYKYENNNNNKNDILKQENINENNNIINNLDEINVNKQYIDNKLNEQKIFYENKINKLENKINNLENEINKLKNFINNIGGLLINYNKDQNNI